VEWKDGEGCWNLLMLLSNEGFARVFDEGILLCEGFFETRATSLRGSTTFN
jgi:hypothetical protein